MPKIIKIWEAGGPRDFWVSEAALIRRFIAKNGIKAMSSRVQLERTMTPELGGQAIAALAAPRVKSADLPRVLKRLGFPGGMEAPHLHFEGKIYPLDSKQWRKFAALALESFRTRLDKTKAVSFDQVVSLGDAVAKL